jgi:hypothetical protein
MMRRRLTVLVLAFFALATAPNAFSQASRTWVSGVGDDANPCSRTAPCKTFAGAISRTAVGGEIDALDPGGFGAVTITKSITIDGSGTFAAILAAGTTGVVVNGTNIIVKLRGLSINGVNGSLSPGVNGVRIVNAKAVRLEDVDIFGFSQNGVTWETTANGRLFVTGSDIHDNNAAGIRFQPATTGADSVATIVDSTLSSNQTGVLADGSRASLLIRDVTVSDNTTNGLRAQANAKVNVESSTFDGNGTGISADTNASVRVSNAVIVGNTTGISAAGGGQINSRQNNTLRDNGTNGTFSGTFNPN